MIRVGIAGAGFMGKQHYQAYRMLEGVCVTAFADSNEDKIRTIIGPEECAVYSDIEEMLASKEIDVVDICLPTFLHKKFTLSAAAHGKHIFCEKPIALHVQDAQEMMLAAKTGHVLLAIGHCLRFSGEYLMLKELCENHLYGELRSLRMYRHSAVPDWSENNWLMKNDQSGGAALDLHIHDVDMLTFLLGNPSSVLTRGSLNDLVTLYEYPENRAAITIESSWQSPSKLPFRAGYDAAFEQATLFCDTDRVILIEGQNAPRIIDASFFRTEPDYLAAASPDPAVYLYLSEINYFMDCIKESKPPHRLDPAYATNALAIVLAEMESLQTEQFVGQTIVYESKKEETKVRKYK